MKLKTISIVAIVPLLALSACSDPADKTADAKVSESAPVAAASGGKAYAFSAASTLGFVGSKVTGSHEGGFKEFEGRFILEDGVPKAGGFTIQMDSTWSDADKLTEHLKAEDFFDVAYHPTATFEVTAFAKQSESAYELSGNLTLRGVTKNISFPTQVATEGDAFRVTAEFDINRQDFGIAYAGMKDDLIRDTVIIKFDLEAKPQA